MPKFSPWKKYSKIATIDSIAETGKLMRRKRMKSNLVSSGTIRRRRTGRLSDDLLEHGLVRDHAQIGTVRGRHTRTQYATIRRVSVKAVNRLVRMPMPSVTAKPRTGPVP